ncbi:MAG: hypothetical protein ACJAZ3_000661 [Sphingobacteriales bacterium]|jgi:hypothetical protein
MHLWFAVEPKGVIILSKIRTHFINLKNLLTLLFSLLLSTTVLGQKVTHFFGVTSSADIGWWIYNNGLENGQAKGYDRSHVHLGTNHGIIFKSSLKKIQIHVKGGVHILYDDVIYAFDHSEYNSNVFRIREKDKLLYIGYLNLGVGYPFFNKKNYKLSLQGEIGSFKINTIHPAKENFGRKLNYTISTPIEFFKNSYVLQLEPMIYNYNIQTINTGNTGAHHSIYGVGVNFGLFLILGK